MLFDAGSVIEGPPTTSRWLLTQGRFFRVLSSVMNLSLMLVSVSGRNLNRTVCSSQCEHDSMVIGVERTDVDDSHFVNFSRVKVKFVMIMRVITGCIALF